VECCIGVTETPAHCLRSATAPVQITLNQVHSRSIARETKNKKMTQSNYTHEMAETICSRMSEGESLRAICRDPGMPSEGTVRGWAVRNVDGFGERYRAARQLLMEYWADQIVDIADDGDLDPRDRQIRTGVRQWLMSKLAPRRYGDRLLHSGDPENPVLVMHKAVSLADLTEVQLAALETFTESLLVDAKSE